MASPLTKPIPAPIAPSGPAAQAPLLGRKTARGFAWLVAQTLGTRMASAVEQIILAWLLLPQDFGLVALAYTVTQFIDIVQQAGLRDVLIQRQAHFNYWANPAFWMSAVMGLAASLLMAAAAPLAASLYKAPQLTP
ncbi:MAG TPA: oligosaccharide flippase family protein, partial [Abditibacteriaceae bacterium]|nr:oligosaccharide flippase family protein [Abditibacteriaceae bacterium]